MARIAIAGLSYTESIIMRNVQRISTLIVYVCIGSGYAQTDNDCGRERFRCRNGECVAVELLCNGRADCKDSSDETEVECKKIHCPDYSFRCNYGGCIDKDYVCNGNQDCVDNSDEMQLQCRTTRDMKNQTKRSIQCETRVQFTCNNGMCIPPHFMCDGDQDCADGSDETSALCVSIPCDGFRCDYGGCLDDRHKLCNGEHECADGSDESPKLCAKIKSSSLPPVQSETTQSSYGVLTQYSLTHPTVTPGTKTCKAPPQPQNGRWMLHRSQCLGGQECNVPEGTELGLGSYLIYSCNPGYKIIGPTDVSCSIEGKWLNVPVCTEIRCEALSTASVEARCTYENKWVSCESPVPPRTKAVLTCRNSYRRETSLLSRQRNNVRCNAKGQWKPEPIRCVPGPHS